MTEKRKYKKGYKIFKGAEVYSLVKNKPEILEEDLIIKDWFNHVGHIRYYTDEGNYSFVTGGRGAKQFYEILY